MFRVILLLVVSAHVDSSANTRRSIAFSALEYSKHVGRVSTSTFPCRTPQKRMVSLREIVGDEEFGSKFKKIIHKIEPFGGSILHRCENSGCCDHYNQICGVESENIVKLTFRIQRVPFEFFTVSAANHTSCACQTVEENRIK